MNMSVKVTGLESTKDRKAVYNTGTGTRERGHWDACVGTWDLSPKSLHNLASHAGVFRGARISSLPTNACSTEDNVLGHVFSYHELMSHV